ncbi:hypothetical protein MULP_03588 [Mycobacterium liflandii 128FXT]|uniref:Uncharacterized protein n=1 Tax=Mycobacterium liflandii (strain 128FXT) TaxID=459424 RepID=L7V9W1_MYCL1|nr:hypothetical protein MULP_03588 [Mycobacterium liflandii 128FXT]
MADLAVGAGRPTVNDWTIAGHISAAQPSRAVKLPRNTIRQQIVNTVLAAYAVVTTRRRRRPSQRHCHRRESFVEDAAMSREMFRL